MNNFYDSAIYLNTSDLNDIENNIETLTNEIQEHVFNNQKSPLRNIRVGDNLSGKTLYLSFPKDLYKSTEIINTSINITSTSENIFFIRFWSYQYSSYARYQIYLSGFKKNSTTREEFYVYWRDSNELNPRRNNIRIKLPNNFGTVSNVDDSYGIVNYMKIYDNESIIPNYEKHIWEDNEPLSMQKLDNIERGVKNIGYYYRKPIGWLSDRQWLKTITIEDNFDVNLNKQNISYQDLNRWVNNLSLINFENLDNICIWNSDISNIQWNKYNDTEWEEY